MSVKVCLGANCLRSAHCSGHLWVFLNWALGLRSLGCDVIWLEWVKAKYDADDLEERVQVLKSRLAPFGLDTAVALWPFDERCSGKSAASCLDLDAAVSADLFINIAYDGFAAEVVARFRRAILIDIDPGLTQEWIMSGRMKLHRHHRYFTIGETVGRSNAGFSSCGVRWLYTAPPIALEHWPVSCADRTAPYTTLTNWWGPPVGADGNDYANAKKDGFLPFMQLPSMTTVPLKLAVGSGDGYDEDLPKFREAGWDVCSAAPLSDTPELYRSFVQQSRGEFSCAKPWYVRLETAWISDRTIAYLASGKPAVVQHTGRSRFLPDAGGLFRLRTPGEAVRAFEVVESDYERQCRVARALAEEHFDARKVVKSVLERALS